MHRPSAIVLVGVACWGGSAGAQPTTNPSSPTAPTTPAPLSPAAPQARPDEHVRTRAADGTIAGPARVGWWNDSVFYEVFVRSFKDSSSGALAGDGVGDIPGLIEKLDYLNDGNPASTTDLGVTGLWLMPINPSPSYHGYDVTDYYGVQKQYGSLDDVRRLMVECHNRGIRVIFDLVLNHCSSEHHWFTLAADPASDKHDWFVWSQTDPGWKGPWGERVWHKLRRAGLEGAPGPYYYGIFGGRMPDLNYRTQAVSDEMLKVVDFWVDRAHGIGADGYRLDAVRHLIEDGQVQENTPETHAWLRKFHAELRRANQAAVSIGEVWTGPDVSASYVGSGPEDAELDMTFEFDLASALVEAAKSGKAKPVIDAQARALQNYPPNQYGRFLSNHDQMRVMTSLKGDAGAMRSAAAMLLLGPGVPFIYYGEELGMTGDKPDEHLRRPMRWEPGEGGETAGFTTGKPWEPLGQERAGVNVRAESDDPDSLLSWYKKLIRLRRQHGALASGGYAPVDCDNPGVYAFVRTGEEPVLVVMNLTNAAVSDYALDAAGPALKGWRVVRDLERDLGAGATTTKPAASLAAHEVSEFGLAQ